MKTITAVYENGIFRPREHVDLPPGAEVQVMIGANGVDAVAVLKARFPESFGGLPRKDGEEMMRIIDEEFEKVDPDDWK